jgi:hypothetical protein
VSRRSGRWPAGAWAHPKRLVIEEPWLVNGGHGASLRHHNSACGRVPGRPPHRASPTSTAGHHQIMIFCLYEPYYNTIITTQPRVTTFGTPTSKCWPHTPARKPHMYAPYVCGAPVTRLPTESDGSLWAGCASGRWRCPSGCCCHPLHPMPAASRRHHCPAAAAAARRWASPHRDLCRPPA